MANTAQNPIDPINPFENGLPEHMSIKTTHKRVQLVPGYITSDMELRQVEVKHSVEFGENIIRQIFFQYRYVCGHLHNFENNNAGLCTNDSPVVQSRVVRNHYKRVGEIYVCKSCVRICCVCGRETTLLTGYINEKTREYWCESCAPGHGFRQFVSCIDDVLTGGGR